MQPEEKKTRRRLTFADRLDEADARVSRAKDALDRATTARQVLVEAHELKAHALAAEVRAARGLDFGV